MITHGPTGNLVSGHVLDVNKDRLTEALKAYDPQLYVYWNPRKNRGWGTWEIRQKPSRKTAIHMADFDGASYVSLETVESDLVHHVLDTPTLGYHVLAKIKEMDVWSRLEDEGLTINQAIDYYKNKYEQETRANSRAETAYMAKQFKRELRDLKELLNSGVSLGRIVSKMK